MNVLDFAGEVIFVSASGVLFPGSLFLVNLICGTKQSYRAGLRIATGHAIIEFPLVIILTIGFSTLTNISTTTDLAYNLDVIGLIGGTSIIVFSLLQIMNITSEKTRRFSFRTSRVSITADKPVLLGIIFSALNPFFIAWWLTIGLKLILDSTSIFGVIMASFPLFSFHIWMDYVWLILTSYLIFKGVSIINTRYYYFLLVGLDIMLTCYGTYMIISSVSL